MTDQITSTGTVWRARVTVLPKLGVNDPAGDSIRVGLEQLDYRGVAGVRVGKLITLSVTADDEGAAREAVGRMCDQLLANPVIESYEVEIAGEEVAR